MASDESFVQFVTDQMRDAGTVRYRKMFGEYALYCNEKVVALICDNRLYVKATDAGRAFIGDPVEAPPYPGAKHAFLVEDRIDDREWLGELIRITFEGLPEPKKKVGKKR